MPSMLIRRLALRTASLSALGFLGAWFVVVGHATDVRNIAPQGGELAQAKRPVAVADLIEMNALVSNNSHLRSPYDKPTVAEFSPDRTRFVVVTKKGDLETNTNVYSLLLFRTQDALTTPQPERLVSFASSSNRPGIEQVRWQNKRTLTFLAEKPGEQHQLYTIDCETKQVQRLTDSPTSLTAYAISENEEILFTATKPTEPILSDSVRRSGLIVTTEALLDLMSGQRGLSLQAFSYCLFRQKKSTKEIFPIPTRNPLGLPWMWPSPDGRYIIVPTTTIQYRESWKDYEDRQLQIAMGGKYGPHSIGESSPVYQFELIDLKLGTSGPLIDAPLADVGESDPIWSRDSSSVVIFQTYLPLINVDQKQYNLRKHSQFVAQVKIPSREINPISAEELRFVRWERNRIIFDKTISDHVETVVYEEAPTQPNEWHEITSNIDMPLDKPTMEIRVDEDRNTAPRIFAIAPGSQSKSLLLDPNPQFVELSFGEVKAISFAGKDGRNVHAELYLPPDIEERRKYPLVIQTHGWRASAANKFRPDGPYPGVFAAQPLAGKGIIVLQVDYDQEDMGTPKEAASEMSAYEAGIDYLDRMGIIDRNRVGIMAFSRSGVGVEYALTHSQYRFAAATIADVTDLGYFRYLVSLVHSPASAADQESINGGLPFTESLGPWLKSSPGFNLYKVRTPVRLEVHSVGELVGVWEWFAVLSRMARPVELLCMPGSTHVPEKPWERRTSQQGAVEWFCFWLKGEEDTDPSKAKQYSRWRKLRNM